MQWLCVAVQVLSVSSCRCDEAVPPAASRGKWPLLTAADGRSVWWHPACKTRSANLPTQSAFTPSRSRISARSIPAAFTCFYLRGDSLLHDRQTGRKTGRKTGSQAENQESSAGMDAAESRLERSSHTAFIDKNTLYVWGGYQVSN